MWPRLRSILFPVWCLGCGEPEIVLCARCARASPVQARESSPPIVALGEYSGSLREAILRLKRGERRAADALAALLAPHLVGAAALVPVPTTRRRRAERGFDQSLLVARLAGERARVPVFDILEKRHGPAQHGRSRAQRLTASGRYVVRRGTTVPRAAILLDDVCTTGATIVDAAGTLHAAGALFVGAWTLAWSPGDDVTGA